MSIYCWWGWRCWTVLECAWVQIDRLVTMVSAGTPGLLHNGCNGSYSHTLVKCKLHLHKSGLMSPHLWKTTQLWPAWFPRTCQSYSSSGQINQADVFCLIIWGPATQISRSAVIFLNWTLCCLSSSNHKEKTAFYLSLTRARGVTVSGNQGKKIIFQNIASTFSYSNDKVEGGKVKMIVLLVMSGQVHVSMSDKSIDMSYVGSIWD